MKISIITVCYNAADTVRDCVASVSQQQLPDGLSVEHRLVDGASTDGTCQLLAELQKEFDFEWVSEADAGLYYAMNKGIQQTSGQIIGFLNADDWYASEHVLAEVIDALSNQSVDGCYADLHYVKKDDPQRVVRNWKAGHFEPGAFFRGWMPPHPTFYARREVYERFGDFDTQFRFGADWELLFRLFEIERISVTYVSHHWVTMRLGGETNRSLGNILTNHRECLRAFRKHGFRNKWLFSFRKLYHRLAQFFWR